MTAATLEAAPLLAVDGLTKTFAGRRGRGGRAEVRAVNDVSFEIGRGETLGLVGESGSGKSTAAACLLRLLPSDGGSVVFDGTDVLALPPARLRELRRRIQVVFQDPYGSLDPRFSVRELVEEPLLVHGERSADRRREQALAMLERVGLVRRPGRAEPARLLRRSAAAHRHRAGPRPQPRPGRPRRAGDRPRRLRAGPDPQPPAGAAEGARPGIPVHRPRPRGGAVHVPPDRGDVPRPGRRDRDDGRAVRPAVAPLHDLAAQRRARSPTRRSWSSAATSSSNRSATTASPTRAARCPPAAPWVATGRYATTPRRRCATSPPATRSPATSPTRPPPSAPRARPHRPTPSPPPATDA